jgi:festuclavine dehydrogenase
MHGTILLTAGTGKTSQRMIPFLQQSQVPFLLTSRNPPKACPGIQYVRFDYLDSRGWPNAFNVGCKPPVEAVYLIAPEAAEDSVTLVVDFVKYCVEDQGVKR